MATCRTQILLLPALFGFGLCPSTIVNPQEYSLPLVGLVAVLLVCPVTLMPPISKNNIRGLTACQQNWFSQKYFNFYAFGNLSWVVICVLAGYGGGGNNFNSDNFGSNYGGSNSNFGPMKGGGGGYGGGRGQGPYQCKE